MSNEISISTYPEGWNEVIKTLSFLPDEKARNEFLVAMMLFLAEM
ncbi:hypothetical protein CEB3_c31110 [Peptococcaceae bacterium CEB3]|nr:hypothetical protein CEB3_c31110 [Peptococcaceae bacterium CEB3]